MSHSHRSQAADYDEDDEEYETMTLIQIDLPSTRLELNPDHYLYKEVKGGEKKKVMAKHVKINDLVHVMRDGETSTEAVLDTKKVERTMDIQIADGTVIVNNVIVSTKK